MRFSIWPSPQAPWEDTVATARHAESTGWDGLWLADHFMPAEGDGSATPVAEAWTAIAALAAIIPRIRIGTLVTGNTYRHPPVLAKMAAQVDQISGGRVVLGLGAGWQQNEHEQYGIHYGTVGERLTRLDEACAIITGLFTQPRTTFKGRYYQVEDAVLAPKPVQSPLPLLIGGGGEKRTLRITAKYANEWNVWGTPEVLRQKMAILDGHCRELGRDPGAIQRSAVAMLVLSDDPEVIARNAGAGRPVIAGNVDAVRAIIADYRAAGVDEVIIPDWNLGRAERKTATMDTFIEKVASEFR